MTATPDGRANERDRPLDIVRPGDGDPRHGKASTYSNWQCRCDLCRSAQAAYMRDLRRRRREQAAG